MIFFFSYEDERLSVPSRLPLPGENVVRGENKKLLCWQCEGETGSSPELKAAAELTVCHSFSFFLFRNFSMNVKTQPIMSLD